MTMEYQAFCHRTMSAIQFLNINSQIQPLFPAAEHQPRTPYLQQANQFSYEPISDNQYAETFTLPDDCVGNYSTNLYNFEPRPQMLEIPNDYNDYSISSAYAEVNQQQAVHTPLQLEFDQVSSMPAFTPRITMASEVLVGSLETHKDFRDGSSYWPNGTTTNSSRSPSADTINPSHSPPRRTSFKCSICGRPFTRMRDVQRHKTSRHVGQGSRRLFYCPVKDCKRDIDGKGFLRADHRDAHCRRSHRRLVLPIMIEPTRDEGTSPSENSCNVEAESTYASSLGEDLLAAQPNPDTRNISETVDESHVMILAAEYHDLLTRLTQLEHSVFSQTTR